MLIERLIKKLRKAGYDDLNIAVYFDKWDQYVVTAMLFFFVCIICGVGDGIASLFSKYSLWGSLWVNFVLATAIAGIVLILVLGTAYSLIKDAESKGQDTSPIGMTISRVLSKIAIWLVRSAIPISMVLLMAMFVLSLIEGRSFLGALVGLTSGGVLLLLLRKPYSKFQTRVTEEVTFYCNWVTRQLVDNFDELVSRSGKWHIPVAKLVFKRDNIERYQGVRQGALTSAFCCIATSVILGLAFIPLGAPKNAGRAPEPQTESVAVVDSSAIAGKREYTTAEQTIAQQDTLPAQTSDFEEDNVDEQTPEEQSGNEREEEKLIVGEIVDKSGYADVRKGPSANSELVRTLQDSRSVRYVEVKGTEWCKVYSIDNEYYGYVHKRNVKPMYE